MRARVHSANPEVFGAHPGLKSDLPFERVPTRKGCAKAAVRDNNPCSSFEHKFSNTAYQEKFPRDYTVPIGSCGRREGKH